MSTVCVLSIDEESFLKNHSEDRISKPEEEEEYIRRGESHMRSFISQTQTTSNSMRMISPSEKHNLKKLNKRDPGKTILHVEEPKPKPVAREKSENDQSVLAFADEDERNEQQVKYILRLFFIIVFIYRVSSRILLLIG